MFNSLILLVNSFRNQDRISQLPEALILRILSSLPTKTVIATSVLSKQWRYFWKSVPSLEFNSVGFKSKHQTFSDVVCKSFLSNKAPVLESFHLEFALYKITPIDIGFWIGLAFARNLRELVLDFLPDDLESFTFPSSLCSCNTLEKLKLILILLDISSPVLMKSLRTLHLVFVSYKDDASIRNLLSGCPVLEELEVIRAEDGIVETFTIEVPSLKRLTINDENGGEEFWGYMINAPCLKYLQIEVLQCPHFCLIAPELVKASVSGVRSLTNEKFLGSFTSVKRLFLDLSPLEITFPSGTIFYQLVSLEMYTRQNEWWNLLTPMLEHSPNLQLLKLTDQYLDFHKDYVVGGKWKEPKYVPECLLSHLETFVWERFDWGRKEEKEVATYILKNARRLNKATFSTTPIESEELNKLKKRRKILDELDGVVRASNSCHLVFEFDSICYVSEDSS
ncbi:F-box/FBD/LRR-repeat protein [Cardamine amara subsp. amara]|uniref:F-box/FBD/LRR-repeat protein n=1 Tax=Cardamine amara subsp. amara TaxID=228776 RepID=A0ABD1AEQ6_CARAN